MGELSSKAREWSITKGGVYVAQRCSTLFDSRNFVCVECASLPRHPGSIGSGMMGPYGSVDVGKRTEPRERESSGAAGGNTGARHTRVGPRASFVQYSGKL